MNEPTLLTKLNLLTELHIANNAHYRAMISKSGAIVEAATLEQVPYLPVQLFKLMDLVSVSHDKIVKVLTSSGTTGQQVSKIYLDQETATAQTRTLVEVMKPLLQGKRLPMIIFDTKSVLKNRKSFSARGAGILGFSNFGRKHFYALNDDMSLDLDGLRDYLAEFQGQRILLFGFTYMVWRYVYKEAVARQVQLDFGDSILIHGGGWKKLKDEAVDSLTFKQLLQQQLGIREVHNYYGMVEQVGSIFIECDHGFFHTPRFANVIVRDPLTFAPVPHGQAGLIQVMSELPRSYPGHSLLTEDVGTIFGIDNCRCGWPGTYFTVAGRVPKAELRGCSDTFQGGKSG